MNELLQSIATHYKLGDCIILDKPIYWGTHVRWHVQTAQKDDIFIKESPPFLADTEFFLNIRCQLFAQQSCHFVVPLISDASDRPVFFWKNRLFTLYPWIRSRPASFENNTDIEQVARLSARFLECIRNYPSEKHEMSWNYPGKRSMFCPDRWNEIYQFTYLIDRAINKYGLKAMREAEKLRNWIKKSAGNIGDENVAGLVQQFIHGDMQRFNYLVDKNNHYYLIDYDRLHWSYRLCDIASLATLMGAIYSPENTTRIYMREHWDWEKVFIFIKTISTVSPLTAPEEKLLKEFLGLFLIRNFIGGFDLDHEEYSLADGFVEQLENVVALLVQVSKWHY